MGHCLMVQIIEADAKIHIHTVNGRVEMWFSMRSSRFDYISVSYTLHATANYIYQYGQFVHCFQLPIITPCGQFLLRYL